MDEVAAPSPSLADRGPFLVQGRAGGLVDGVPVGWPVDQVDAVAAVPGLAVPHGLGEAGGAQPGQAFEQLGDEEGLEADGEVGGALSSVFWQFRAAFFASVGCHVLTGLAPAFQSSLSYCFLWLLIVL